MKPQTGSGRLFFLYNLLKENAQEVPARWRGLLHTGKDYAQGQPRYTLLKKEKRNLITNETIVQYDRLTPKDTKSIKGGIL